MSTAERRTRARKIKQQRALHRRAMEIRAVAEAEQHEAKVAEDWMRFLVVRGVIRAVPAPPRFTPCPDCHGQGHNSCHGPCMGVDDLGCDVCEGVLYLDCESCDGTGLIDTEEYADAC